MELLVEEYMQEVVRFCGVPVSIVSDRDTTIFSPLLEKSPRKLGNSLEVQQFISSAD